MKRLQHRSTLFPYTTLFRSNAYVDENRKHLPIEFTLTGVEPIPWTPAHSHVMARLMAWEMNVSWWRDRKSTRLNSSHVAISYAVFCLKKKNAYDMKTRMKEQLH